MGTFIQGYHLVRKVRKVRNGQEKQGFSKVVRKKGESYPKKVRIFRDFYLVRKKVRIFVLKIKV